MMNSTNKLSVIIPLYNAGDDFRTCMESLIAQTWTALEIIIINDGSTDNSVEIAKHYAENYPHVRLLHSRPGGRSLSKGFPQRQNRQSDHRFHNPVSRNTEFQDGPAHS